jgi:hypothetical protein
MGQAALLPGAGEVGNLSGQQTETGGGANLAIPVFFVAGQRPGFRFISVPAYQVY